MGGADNKIMTGKGVNIRDLLWNYSGELCLRGGKAEKPTCFWLDAEGKDCREIKTDQEMLAYEQEILGFYESVVVQCGEKDEDGFTCCDYSAVELTSEEGISIRDIAGIFGGVLPTSWSPLVGIEGTRSSDIDDPSELSLLYIKPEYPVLYVVADDILGASSTRFSTKLLASAYAIADKWLSAEEQCVLAEMGCEAVIAEENRNHAKLQDHFSYSEIPFTRRAIQWYVETFFVPYLKDAFPPWVVSSEIIRLGDNNNYGAAYDPSNDLVVLNTDFLTRPFDSQLFILAHEFAHRLFLSNESLSLFRWNAPLDDRQFSLEAESLLCEDAAIQLIYYQQLANMHNVAEDPFEELFSTAIARQVVFKKMPKSQSAGRRYLYDMNVYSRALQNLQPELWMFSAVNFVAELESYPFLDREMKDFMANVVLNSIPLKKTRELSRNAATKLQQERAEPEKLFPAK